MRNSLRSKVMGATDQSLYRKKCDCPLFEWQKVHVTAKMVLVDEYDSVQISMDDL